MIESGKPGYLPQSTRRKDKYSLTMKNMKLMKRIQGMI